jgi:alkanesulfonate monooxygenase SsuD/methylene tetrahydromethanopterin reductase-like flavin-dependent oxidoreductase (luciferase family)
VSAMEFGVHTGLQGGTVEDLVTVWREAEDMEFSAISVWDHFYSSTNRNDPCLEAVSMHAALALSTTRVTCGSIVYSVAYRHPGVLAKAVTTIDHLSGGRAEIGLGAGWARQEFDAFGIPFGTAESRATMLEEAACCIRGLLHDGAASFDGRYFHLRDAVCCPSPVQDALPIWIGGGGERRTLPTVARYADGWNAPYLSPSSCHIKNTQIDTYCQAIGRAPASVRRAVNLALASDEDALAARYGHGVDGVRTGALTGSVAQMTERVALYQAAGIDRINVSVRAPFELGMLERVACVADAYPA